MRKLVAEDLFPLAAAKSLGHIANEFQYAEVGDIRDFRGHDIDRKSGAVFAPVIRLEARGLMISQAAGPIRSCRGRGRSPQATDVHPAKFIERVLIHASGRRVRGTDRPRRVENQERVVADLEQRAIALLAFAQLDFAEFALGDVLCRSDEPRDRCCELRRRKSAVVNPAHRTVRTDDAIFVLVRDAGRPMGKKIEYIGAVVRMDRVDKRPWIREQFLAGPPPNPLVAGADVMRL